MTDAIERRAATLAAEVTETLMRPTTARGPVQDQLDDLRALHAEATILLPQVRRSLERAAGGKPAEHPDRLWLKRLRHRLRIWPQVVQAAEDCAAGHEWPLLTEPAERLDMAGVEATVISNVFTVAHRAVNPEPQAADAGELGCFPDIALNAWHFFANAHLALRLMLARKQPGPYRFLDVGCGGGLKVALAAELFHHAEGLEYDAGYVAVARRTLLAMRAGRCTVIHADGLTFDGYGDHDVIYFYQPMKVEDGLLALERRIAEQARPGTILIAPYNGFPPRAAALGCTRIEDAVFVKDLSPADAEVLMAETRRMGPQVVHPVLRRSQATGWLAPLWHACEMNGIRPGYRGGGLSALL